jgi:hypothetical protein
LNTGELQGSTDTLLDPSSKNWTTNPEMTDNPGWIGTENGTEKEATETFMTVNSGDQSDNVSSATNIQ